MEQLKRSRNQTISLQDLWMSEVTGITQFPMALGMGHSSHGSLSRVFVVVQLELEHPFADTHTGPSDSSGAHSVSDFLDAHFSHTFANGSVIMKPQWQLLRLRHRALVVVRHQQSSCSHGHPGAPTDSLPHDPAPMEHQAPCARRQLRAGETSLKLEAHSNRHRVLAILVFSLQHP